MSRRKPTRRSSTPLWVWWIPVVWLVSAPVGFTPDPLWDRVNLIPFLDRADKLSDMAVNLLLFVPFGYSFTRDPGGALRLVATAGAVSIGAELMQVFSTVRHPSTTDVCLAIAGALAGAGAARWRRPAAKSPWTARGGR